MQTELGKMGFGIGLAVYTDTSDVVHKLAAINEIGFDSDGARDSFGELAFEFNKLMKKTLAEKYHFEVVNSGRVLGIKVEGVVQEPELGTSAPKLFSTEAAGHEEIFLRRYLQEQIVAGGAIPVSKATIPVGVSQNTVCGRCVADLLKGQDPRTDEALKQGTSLTPQASVSATMTPGVVERMLVQGANLAHLLASMGGNG